MIWGILYKEWLKTRWFLLAALLSACLVMVFWYKEMLQSFSANGALFFTYKYAVQGMVYQLPLKVIPVIFALLLSLFQFLPEISSRRYRLTIRLPYSETQIITNLMLFGITAIFLLSILLSAGFYLVSCQVLPIKLVHPAYSLLLTWMLSGVLSYLWASAILFEPKWSVRLILAFPGICFVALGLSNAINGTTVVLNYVLATAAIFSLCLPFFTMYRLRKGLS